ncbi:GIY-YIG nuclease family protein [bacterium]|nr:GIY-YIG nuclease family protein [bacterium]
MNVSALNPQPVDRLRFKHFDLMLVPTDSGCYVLTNFEGLILYIGMATSLKGRFLSHLESTEKTSPTVYGLATWFWYLRYDKGNLPKLERTWLNEHLSLHGCLPVLNRVSSPIV